MSRISKRRGYGVRLVKNKHIDKVKDDLIGHSIDSGQENVRQESSKGLVRITNTVKQKMRYARFEWVETRGGRLNKYGFKCIR